MELATTRGRETLRPVAYTKNVMTKMNDLYTRTAQALAAQVAKALPESLHAVVLYGSVARGEARTTSDIDVLMLVDRPDTARSPVSAIEEDLDAGNNYRTFLNTLYFSVDDFRRSATAGSRLVQAILEEGKVLYDDGSFAGICNEVLAGGRRDAVRREAHV